MAPFDVPRIASTAADSLKGTGVGRGRSGPARSPCRRTTSGASSPATSSSVRPRTRRGCRSSRSPVGSSPTPAGCSRTPPSSPASSGSRRSSGRATRRRRSPTAGSSRSTAPRAPSAPLSPVARSARWPGSSPPRCSAASGTILVPHLDDARRGAARRPPRSGSGPTRSRPRHPVPRSGRRGPAAGGRSAIDSAPPDIPRRRPRLRHGVVPRRGRDLVRPPPGAPVGRGRAGPHLDELRSAHPQTSPGDQQAWPSGCSTS